MADKALVLTPSQKLKMQEQAVLNPIGVVDAAMPRREFSLSRHGPMAFGLTSGTLLLNLLTGIIVARSLGADGRGEITAVVSIVPIVTWLFALGSSQAVAYYQARHPDEGGRLLAAWLILLVPLSAAAVLAGQLLLPYVLAAQDDAVLTLARLYMLTVVSTLVADLIYGMVLGDHDFTFYYLMRLGQTAAVAASLTILWAVGALTVETALLSLVIASVVDSLVAGLRIFRRHGLARPTRALVRSTVWYGFRAHGPNFGGVVNARLDLIVIPAFLGAVSVGLYSVATNVTWIVITVAGALAQMVLPAAARKNGEHKLVIESLQLTLVVGTVIAAAIAVAAGFVLPLVYGSEFAAAETALRLLLPGVVLFAGAAVLQSGLYAANQPARALLSQGLGAVVTVVGLVLFLDRGGIEAAALVSTVSYAVVFVVSLWLHSHASGIGIRFYLPSVQTMRALFGLGRSLLRRAVHRNSRVGGACGEEPTS